MTEARTWRATRGASRLAYPAPLPSWDDPRPAPGCWPSFAWNVARRRWRP